MRTHSSMLLMSSRKITCFISTAVLLSVLLISISYYIHNSTRSSQQPEYRPKFAPFQPSKRSTNQVPNYNLTFPILYLTQTEKCLPDNLKSPEVIGDKNACHCDILVLSYREPCKDTSLPHVKYIFQHSATWTTGRNLLYEISKVRDKFYLYYIFIDDDLELHPFDKETQTKANLWRMFENSLRTVQPPVATVMDANLISINLTQPKECKSEHVTDFVEVFWFDAIIGAFHYEAVDHILPYRVKFDRRSWYYSQMYIIIRSDVKFHGQVVGHTQIRAENPQHHRYPKEGRWDTFITVADDVREEIPKEYLNRTETIFQKWKDDYMSMLFPGNMYCSEPLKPNTIKTHRPYITLK